MWEVRVDGATEAGKHGPVPEVWFLRSFSVHPGRVPIMTASAKDVIAAALLDGARNTTAAERGMPIDQRLATAILAALDAAGYGVYRIKTIRTPFGSTVKLPVSDNLAAQESES